MRTTLTLEPDVAQQIRQRMAEKKLSLKQIVNEALREGLAKTGKKEKRKPFIVEPFALEFMPGIDPTKLNKLLDELDVEDYLAKRSQ